VRNNQHILAITHASTTSSQKLKLMQPNISALDFTYAQIMLTTFSLDIPEIVSFL